MFLLIICFVIKATHDPGWNIFIRDKKNIDGKAIAQCLNESLQRIQSYPEVAVKSIIIGYTWNIIEEFIQDKKFSVPPDYKLFVFHGWAQYVQVDVSRYKDHRRNLYHWNWYEQDFRYCYLKGTPVNRPQKLAEMLAFTEKLEEDFDFCRVDLYAPADQQIFFGEITLVPESGVGRFYPGEWDYKFGDVWSLPDARR